MKIAFLGDIAFFGKFCLNNNDNLYKYFDAVKLILDDCDYVVGNLETPFCSNGKMFGSKSAYISSDELNVEILKYLGVDVVSLANNHMFDFGDAGFLSTISILNENKIEWFGCNDKILRLDFGGEKIAFHGYCSLNTNPLGIMNNKSEYFINSFDAEIVIDNMCNNNKLGYFNVLSVHSGVEHVNIPSYEDVRFARYLADEMQYIYHGHHPHVLQGIDNHNDSLISYSLGNFCFDDIYDHRTNDLLVKQSENNKSSMILIVEIENGSIHKYDAVGIRMGDDELLVHTDSKVDEYSEYLKMTNSKFNIERNNQIKKVKLKINSKRDLNWFVSRLNLSTIERVYAVYKNRKKHKKIFGDFFS